MLVARLNPLGPSGGPEIEMVALLIPLMTQEEITEVVAYEFHHRPDKGNGAHRFKDLGAIFHQIWLELIVAPRIPSPVSAEGGPMVYVTMRFDVLDPQSTTRLWLRSGTNKTTGTRPSVCQGSPPPLRPFRIS